MKKIIHFHWRKIFMLRKPINNEGAKFTVEYSRFDYNNNRYDYASGLN